MKTPATSVAVAIKGADMRAGSKPKLLKSSGKAAPAVAAKVVIATRLIPAAEATNQLPPLT